ncbi:EF2563 family selenium-dependent molybdenum hydroxylase system protein [Christensenellaceae bacterium OttesenSCG-928-M15]|nr:EF2563 family selenium-dependent molybdenum hydroxylase system protein [Christensenellaceae bacterium OttesenSCG-928-M15]
MRVVIKGAGDIASGIALCLHRAGMQLVMTDVPEPTAIRRSVAFSPAVTNGSAMVEDVAAYLAKDAKEALEIMERGNIAILVDERAACIAQIKPDAVVDAILAKQNLGTTIEDAPIVVGVGPGFCAKKDCHAVVETQRGHDLGRIILEGTPEPNTGIPGIIGGYGLERVVRTPCAGKFEAIKQIGDRVAAGDLVAKVDGREVRCEIGGILRGILPDGIMVYDKMKCADVDPRCEVGHCYSASDKARAIGGGVLTALLMLEKQHSH